MCAEIAGDIHLGDSRQPTCKNFLPFMEWELEVSNVNYDRRDSRCQAVATNSNLRSGAAQAINSDLIFNLCLPKV